MDYEKAYKVVLKTATQWIKDGCTDKEKICLECVFPELRESEDERIRKKLYNTVMGTPNDSTWFDGTSKEAMLAYLEKQKYDRMKPIYDARESFESALEKAWNDYHNGYENVDKLEDDYVECAHAKGFREGYLFGLEKQKEHQNNSDAPNESSWTGLISSSDKDKNLDEIAQDYVDGVKEYNPEPTWDLMQTAVCYGYHYREQKEQKPAEKQDYSGLNDLERAIHRGFLCAGVENVPVTIIKETAKECLAQMEPAEWSEEDERMRNQLIYDVEHHKKDGLISAKQNKATKTLFNEIEKCYDEKIAWLKSLRPQPHWRPMRLLRCTKCGHERVTRL